MYFKWLKKIQTLSINTSSFSSTKVSSINNGYQKWMTRYNFKCKLPHGAWERIWAQKFQVNTEFTWNICKMNHFSLCGIINTLMSKGKNCSLKAFLVLLVNQDTTKLQVLNSLQNAIEHFQKKIQPERKAKCKIWIIQSAVSIKRWATSPMMQLGSDQISLPQT